MRASADRPERSLERDELDLAREENERLRDALEQGQRAQLAVLRQLREARRALEDRERIHDNFLRMISHELKTPIASMELTLRLIEREPLVRRSPKLREGIERMAGGSRRLHQLVRTMTEWSRIQSGRRRLRVSLLPLDRHVVRAVESSRRHADRKGVSLETRIDEAASALSSDHELVELLLEALVMRAVQLSDSGTVTVEVDEEPDAHVVRIHDTAEPIRSAEQLFDPLRSPSELLRSCGSGSGLAISVLDDLVRALGGSLELQPRERGNDTILRLPSLADASVDR